MSAPRVLVVGLGGLGCPVLDVLARSGVTRFTLLDDDIVDASNLHRQVLYGDEDVGRKKTAAARERLMTLGANDVSVIDDRLLPENARAIMAGHALVVEGADNLATKFLAVDAARLSDVPLVQGGAVRFAGWAMATPRRNAPCMRCVFEDIPNDRIETCAEAGVLGPVVGVVGALMASIALRILADDVTVAGEVHAYDALAGTLRRTRIEVREDCPLCSGTVHDLSRDRYAPSCAL